MSDGVWAKNEAKRREWGTVDNIAICNISVLTKQILPDYV